MAGWIWTWSEAQPDILAGPNWTLLKEYAGLQGGFYALAIGVDIHLTGRPGKGRPADT